MRLVGQLGMGSLGPVFLAEPLASGPPVVVKLLPPHLSTRPAALERVLAEVQAARRVHHPRIARLLDMHTLWDGQPCLLLEHAEGTPLSQWALPLLPEQVVSLLDQVLKGLEAAHELGVVHRDLRPDHLLLSTSPQGTLQVRLLDLGLAGVLEACLGEEELATGQVPGSPAYLAPEQLQHPEPYGRMDLYSLAVLGYRMLTGRLPFGGGGRRAEMLWGHAPLRPIPPHLLVEHIPLALSAVLQQTLAAYPYERFASARAMRAALERAMQVPALRPRPPPAPKGLCMSLESPGRPGLWPTRMSDVDAEGLFVHCLGPLPPLATRLRAELSFQGWALACQCDVVRHVAGDEARAWEGGPGFYICFAEPLAEMRRMVMQALAAELAEEDSELAQLLARAMPCSRNPYNLLMVPQDASFSAVHQGAQRAERRLAAFLPRPLPPGQRQALESLLERVRAAHRMLGEPLRRLSFDMGHNNLVGVARCLEAGVPDEVRERLRNAWFSTRPGAEARAHTLFTEALLLESQEEPRAALLLCSEAIALDPLNPSLHRYRHSLQQRMAPEQASATAS